MQKLSDIKDDILRHQENMNVKAEIQNNLDDLREIPGMYHSTFYTYYLI